MQIWANFAWEIACMDDFRDGRLEGSWENEKCCFHFYFSISQGIMARPRQTKTATRKEAKKTNDSPEPAATSAAVEPPTSQQAASSASSCFLDEKTLYCEICLDVLYNAMNVAPCNHKFCAGCIFEWHDRSQYCPKCRWWVADITRDPFANVVVEKYLETYPEKKRCTSTLNLLDERELLHLEKYRGKRDEPEDNGIDRLLNDLGEDELDESGDWSTDNDGESDDEDEEEDMSWNELGGLDAQDEAELREMQARHAMEDARIETLRKAKEAREREKAEQEKAERAAARRARKNARRSAGRDDVPAATTTTGRQLRSRATTAPRH